MKIVDYYDENILRVLLEFKDSFYDSTITIEHINNLFEKFRQHAIFRVLQDDDRNLGFYSLYANDLSTKKAFLSMIVVKNDVQGLGYGKQLLLDCFEQSKLKKMCSLRLEVNKHNKRGNDFYRKNGFTIVEENEKSFFLERVL